MFAQKIVANFSRKKTRTGRIDVVAEQVRKILKDSDQKLILMVRS